MWSRKIRSAVIVLVFANLVASAAYALPPTGRQSSPGGPEGVLSAAWEWFGSVLAPVLELGTVWEKEGSSMDPNGSTQSLVSGEMADAGSPMDPNGNN
jgi:hypothetical protein